MLLFRLLLVSQAAQLGRFRAGRRDEIQRAAVRLQRNGGGDRRQAGSAVHQAVKVEQPTGRGRDADAGVQRHDVAHVQQREGGSGPHRQAVRPGRTSGGGNAARGSRRRDEPAREHQLARREVHAGEDRRDRGGRWRVQTVAQRVRQDQFGSGRKVGKVSLDDC